MGAMLSVPAPKSIAGTARSYRCAARSSSGIQQMLPA